MSPFLMVAFERSLKLSCRWGVVHDVDDNDKQVVLFEENLLEVIVVVRFKVDDHPNFIIWFFMLADADGFYILTIDCKNIFYRLLELCVFEIANHPG